jgi:hypothetical protein
MDMTLSLACGVASMTAQIIMPLALAAHQSRIQARGSC